MRRARGVTRRAGTRLPAVRIVVVTEGASTEPTNLKVFSRSHAGRRRGPLKEIHPRLSIV